MSVTCYVANQLSCPHCGTVFHKDARVDLSNKVNPEPGITTIYEGQTLEIDLEDISTDFIRIKEPQGTTIKCAEIWPCPVCTVQNFAEIIYLIRPNDGIVQTITSVVMHSRYLDTIHYLSERIDDWAGYFMDTPIFTSLEPPQAEIDQFKKALDQYNAAQK